MPSNSIKGVENSRENVSDLTTSRLSIYLRCLNELASENVRTVSSHELARRFNLNSAQIRKDLAQFGEFGIRGVGYDVRLLKSHLLETLGLERERRLIIVGAGNLGLALADYEGFRGDGFRTIALLDSNPKKAGMRSRTGVPVLPIDRLESVVREHAVEIGVIAVPAHFAQHVYDLFVAAGICAVLNFAPIQIKHDDHVKVRPVDLRIALESLSYYLKVVDEKACATGISSQPVKANEPGGRH